MYRQFSCHAILQLSVGLVILTPQDDLKFVAFQHVLEVVLGLEWQVWRRIGDKVGGSEIGLRTSLLI